ncbi:2372_t:CDS:2, partial [Racocetra persica]
QRLSLNSLSLNSFDPKALPCPKHISFESGSCTVIAARNQFIQTINIAESQ